MLIDMGIDVSRIQFEDQSRNTRENALDSQLLGSPMPGETWLLVTSAAHMPRAMGVFRAVGWRMLADPVDYRTHDADHRPVAFSLRWSRQIALLGYSLHEYWGLVYYRLRHWTDTLFPAPKTDETGSGGNHLLTPYRKWAAICSMFADFPRIPEPDCLP
jgi:uncharacterized SAM-binding protein YcdF (DUF218 family)